jgi:putative ABC transport system ATP-binding protein
MVVKKPLSTHPRPVPTIGVMAEPAMIELDRVSKIYRTGSIEVRALDRVSLRITEGEMVAIMGHSGSGKSTMMNILGCLDAPTDGHYRLDGVDVLGLSDRELARIRNHKIGFVFQSFNLLPRTTAVRNVELPLVYAGDRGRRERALTALDQVGLAERARHLPNELSGGQQQRVAIARALVTNPSMILADEPTGALDSASTSEVMKLLVELNDAGRTIVVITHEKDVAGYADRVVELIDGRISSDELQQRSAPLADGPAPVTQPIELPRRRTATGT